MTGSWQDILARLMGRKAARAAPRGLSAQPALVARLRQVAEAEGWQFGLEDGDAQALHRTPDRLVRLWFSLDDGPDGPVLRISEVISTPAFSRMVAVIRDGTGVAAPFEPLDLAASGTFALGVLEDDRLGGMLATSRAAAARADVAADLARLAALPTTAGGALPLRHLAALALLRETARLDGYATAFRRGDRLGFVPYITEAMIGRAVAACRAAPGPSEGSPC